MDPFGKIVVAVRNVNNVRNINNDTHDSRAAQYSGLYTKINNLPAPYQRLANQAFKGVEFQTLASTGREVAAQDNKALRIAPSPSHSIAS